MKINATLCFLLAFAVLTPSLQAAIPSRTAAPVPQKIMIGQGAVAGGAAGKGFSLTNVTLAVTPGKERLILDIGDLQGAINRGSPGYFHAELQKKPRRLVVDFSQMPNVLMDEKSVQKRLQGSAAIAHSSILIDPTDQTLSLVLDLKKDVKAEIFQVPGNKGTSRVVVDLL